MRSRNIAFEAKKMKPLAKLFAFFDGEDVTRFCVPKLLQVTMTSGTFQVGETVLGMVMQTGLAQNTTSTIPHIQFRVAQSNHREGPYDAPTSFFTDNPYTTGQIIQATYSSTSTTLNVDCLLYTSPSPRDRTRYRMPSSA